MRYLLAALAALGLLAAVTFPFWSRPVYLRMSDITIAVSVLPTPTGAHGVGRTSLTLPPPAAAPDGGPPVAVDLWYPSSAKDRPEQRPGARITGFGFNQRARAGAAIDGPVADATLPFPLLIYAPGWDGPRHDNTFLLANLASHGYVVAAIDDIGFAASRTTANHAVPEDLGDFDLSSQEAMEQSIAFAARRLKIMTERVSYTLDALANLDRTRRLPLLSGRIDHARAGMLGFSFGGSVAAECALSDKRLLAAANMDGWLFGAVATRLIEKPYLAFNSDFPTLDADAAGDNPRRRLSARLTIADRKQQARQAQRADATLLIFRNLDHADFTDELFSPSLTGYLKRWSRTSSERLRLRKAQDANLLAFFDRHLRGPHTLAPPPAFAGVEPLAPVSGSLR